MASVHNNGVEDVDTGEMILVDFVTILITNRGRP